MKLVETWTEIRENLLTFNSYRLSKDLFEREFFVDEQRAGPYSMWHHQHRIEPIKNGVLMTDIVTYKPSFGILGRLSNQLFIKKQLESIFDFRKSALEKIYGKYPLAE